MKNPNSAQRIAVALGAALLMLAVLFPPVIGLTTGKNPVVEMKGFAFLLLMSGISGGIYFPLLLTELGVITILTIAAFFLLKGDRKTAAREHGVVSRARERIKASASAIVQRLRGTTRTSVGVAITWAVVATLIAAECIFPVTAVHPTNGGLLDGFYFTSTHRPVWLSDPSDILLGRIAFEIVALLLAGLAVSLLLSSKKNARKVRAVWSIGLLLLAGLCVFPPMRVYDSKATSRIVEARRAQKIQALERQVKEESAKGNDVGFLKWQLDQLDIEYLREFMFQKYVRRLIKTRPVSADSAEFASRVRYEVRKRASEIGDSLLKAEEDSVALSKGQSTRSREAFDKANAERILSPSELVYKSVHTPVWTRGQEEIRYHQLALEMLAIVLFAVGATFFLRKKGDN
jgi:hypothetical protein